jgi:hypothetical protein
MEVGLCARDFLDGFPNRPGVLGPGGGKLQDKGFQGIDLDETVFATARDLLIPNPVRGSNLWPFMVPGCI